MNMPKLVDGLPGGQEFVVTVWNDGGWKVWGAMDAEYAKADPDYLTTITLGQLIQTAAIGGTEEAVVISAKLELS